MRTCEKHDGLFVLVLPSRLCRHQWTHIGFGAVDGNLLASHRFQCLRCGALANIIRDGQNNAVRGAAEPRTVDAVLDKEIRP